MSDSKSSMDELILRTIGLVESLPERLGKLEDIVHSLERSFLTHEGEQSQGIKRLVDRMNSLEKALNELSDSFIECQRGKISPQLCEDMKNVQHEIQLIQEELRPLRDDLNTRELTRKTLWHYVKEVFSYFLRYAMLPITMVLMLFIGINPSYIPWYNSNTTQPEKDSQRVINRVLSMTNNNRIREQDILELYQKYNHIFILSHREQKSTSISEYQKDVGRKNLYGKVHLFIWLPYNSDNGTVQIFDKDGSQRHQTILITRGY